MPITLNGDTGITTPGLINTGSTTLINLTTTGNTILGDQSTDTLNVANGNLVLDSSGDLGLGVTPSASWSGLNVIQIGARAAISGSTTYTGLSTNAVATTGGWAANYLTNGFAAFYAHQVSNGQHQWFTAPSGTAGNAISFTQAMTLNSSGNLGIGTTSPAARLDVSGGSIRVNEDGVGTKIITIRSDFAGVDPAINVTTSNSLLLMTSNTERARITSGGNFLVGTTGNGSPGLGVANSTNISFPESTNNTSLATIFRQAGSGDTVLGSGVRYSSTSNGFASSFDLAWARSAVNVGYGAIKFFTAAEATVSVGTDTTMNERARITSDGKLLVGTTGNSGSQVRVASTSNNWAFQSNDIYRVFNHYGAFGSTSTTRTCAIAFTSQGNNWSGHTVEVIFAGANDVSSALVSGKATYVVTSLTVLNFAEIEDIGNGVTFSASAPSGATLTITATTSPGVNWTGWTVRVTSTNSFSAPTSISIA
jgi:hypothetical protein